MITLRSRLATILFATLFASSAMANDELMVFPNDGQSKEQQQQDEFTCYNWSKEQSGFDPMAPPTATEPPPQETASQSNSVARGAVRGAAIGQIAGGDSKSTRRGAAAGVAVSGMKRQDAKRRDEAARQQWEQEQVRIYQENRNRYNRAYAACMEGKNYTVR